MAQATYQTFVTQLGMLLRDLPTGTTAELTDFAVAYWDGRHVVGVYLREDGGDLLDEDFELDENAWANWSDELTAWLSAPRFSERAELKEWLKEAPPFES
ncbi:hypothetical protein PQR37_19265 [Paraburkholderia nemoris]|uniref:hypothetical protein n=1 Tax=Paraburkholderia nemoris TaxID=2793076 RepID=UPI0038BA43E7